MPQRKVDPLGRNHTTIHKPTNRHAVDRVCHYILNTEEKDFCSGDERPRWSHVFFDAYVVVYGYEEAIKMLRVQQEKWDKL